MPGVDEVNAGVATKPPSLPLFARMHPPPALNHPALDMTSLEVVLHAWMFLALCIWATDWMYCGIAYPIIEAIYLPRVFTRIPYSLWLLHSLYIKKTTFCDYHILA